jgi:SEFIR domain
MGIGDPPPDDHSAAEAVREGSRVERWRVLISYSHDSPPHAAHVKQFADRLRSDGIDCIIDQYIDHPPQGWPLWMEQEVKKADYVLVVCTETYARRAMGEERAGAGLGVQFESSVIRQGIYDAAMWNVKFIPVLLKSSDAQHIITSLRGVANYKLDTDDGYEKLYRRLTDQPHARQPPLGPLRNFSQQGAPSPPAPRSDPVPPYDGTKPGATSSPVDSDSGILPMDPLEVQVGRQGWPELMDFCTKTLAPEAAKIAQLPGFITHVHQANVEAGIEAVRRALTEDDAKVLFHRKNLETFIRLIDEFRTKWLGLLRSHDQPRRKEVEDAFFRTIGSTWVCRDLNEEQAKLLVQTGNIEEFVDLLEAFRKDWLHQFQALGHASRKDVEATFRGTIERYWNKWYWVKILGVIAVALLVGAGIGFTAAVIWRS